jgi:hypothetical protein
MCTLETDKPTKPSCPIETRESKRGRDEGKEGEENAIYVTNEHGIVLPE